MDIIPKNIIFLGLAVSLLQTKPTYLSIKGTYTKKKYI